MKLVVRYVERNEYHCQNLSIDKENLPVTCCKFQVRDCMPGTKKRREKEYYEKYWKFTAAFTDFHDEKFTSALDCTIKFIQTFETELKNCNEEQFSGLYKELQSRLVSLIDLQGKNPDASARKMINQFVKMGIVEPYLKGFDPRILRFLSSSDQELQNRILSEILYDNASFVSSTTVDRRDEPNPIKFLLNTLANLPEDRIFNINDLTAIMLTDLTLSKYKEKNYITVQELDFQKRHAATIDFQDRKYNQINHLFSLLSVFSDIKCDRTKGTIQLKKDTSIVVNEDISTVRDPYRYNIYRGALSLESESIYEERVCYLTKQPLKGLVASHIVPSSECIRSGRVDDAYNPNNGLLLSPNVDAYFDKGDITFDEKGNVVARKDLKPEILSEFKNKHLDKEILNDQRQSFLKEHREKFKSKYGEGIKC